jgi:hypothetical protein
MASPGHSSILDIISSPRRRRMRIAFCLFLTLVAGLGAQEPARGASGATVSGVVRDSLGRGPLAEAVVQLVSSGARPAVLSATSDSAGRYAIANVPGGQYTIGFLHPILDSLGLEPPQRDIVVPASGAVRVDLATPSAARLRATICARAVSPARTVIIGFVRNARDGDQLGGAHVVAQWDEISLGDGKPVRRAPRLVATSASNGWFAICNVPATGTMALSAGHGNDSTDIIEMQMPADGFLRRDLYVGRAPMPARDAVQRTDSVPRARPVRRGEGRLRGTVVAALDGRPLANASVGIVDGPQTRANERGEWTLVDAPLGTRVLEVRAVGYYPTRRAVDVLTDAPPVRVNLSTLKAVLDTVRITSARIADFRGSGFEDRRRTGLGRYIAGDEIARRQPLSIAPLLRMFPGVRIDRDSSGFDTKILLRASVDDWCYPAIYVNGHYMRDLDTDDLDAWMRPSDILGIEVYAGVAAPVQYQQGMTGCGSILIWTKS